MHGLVAVVPLAPLTAVLTAIVRSTAARRPSILERLGPHADKRFGIHLSDASLAFVLEPRRLRATAIRGRAPHADVRIAGPLTDLLDLLEGAHDADALFFSRRLTIEGDVEAALALHNALDDAGVDFAAEAAALAPVFRPAAERGLRGAMALFKGVWSPQWS